MIKVHFHVTSRKLRDPIIQKLNFSLRKREGEYMITKKFSKSPPNESLSYNKLQLITSNLTVTTEGSASKSPHLTAEQG